MNRTRIAMVVFSLSWITACAPTIYVIDQHTVLEQEAAGDWPEFEKEMLRTSSEATPAPFQKTEISSKKSRLFNVLNSDLVTQ